MPCFWLVASVNGWTNLFDYLFSVQVRTWMGDLKPLAVRHSSAAFAANRRDMEIDCRDDKLVVIRREYLRFAVLHKQVARDRANIFASAYVFFECVRGHKTNESGEV